MVANCKLEDKLDAEKAAGATYLGVISRAAPTNNDRSSPMGFSTPPNPINEIFIGSRGVRALAC